MMPLMKVAFLYLSTGIALFVAVAAIVGVGWLAVAVPVAISTAAHYGLLVLTGRLHKRGTRSPRSRRM